MIVPLQPIHPKSNKPPSSPPLSVCCVQGIVISSGPRATRNDQEDVREPHSAEESRGVYYCPVVNLFVVYRTAKWSPGSTVPYGVHRRREQRGGRCERDTCCYITTPIVGAYCCAATISLRREMNAAQGTLIAHHLTLCQRCSSF